MREEGQLRGSLYYIGYTSRVALPGEDNVLIGLVRSTCSALSCSSTESYIVKCRLGGTTFSHLVPGQVQGLVAMKKKMGLVEFHQNEIFAVRLLHFWC